MLCLTKKYINEENIEETWEILLVKKHKELQLNLNKGVWQATMEFRKC